MPSEAQRRAGFLLPAQLTDHDLICVKMKIPDSFEYRTAFTGHVFQLGRWHVWEKDWKNPEDRRATIAGSYWKDLLHEHFQIVECEEDEDEDEDILDDILAALADGILTNQVSGGIVRAIGYALGVDAQVVAETALNIVGITLIGGTISGAVGLAVGGASVGTVEVAAGEIVELMIETGASSAAPKIIELIGLAA